MDLTSFTLRLSVWAGPVTCAIAAASMAAACSSKSTSSSADASTCSPLYFSAADGGENTACESCIAASCESQQCKCDDDPATYEGGNNAAPGCLEFVNCVDLAVTDGIGGPMTVSQAESGCTGGVASSSQSLGAALLSCAATNCASVCP